MLTNIRKKESILSRFALVIFLFVISFSLIISYFFLSMSRSNFDALTNNIESTRVEQLNKEAKQRIDQVIELIEFQRDQIVIRIKDKMRLKSRNILSSINSIESSNNKKLNINLANKFIDDITNSKNRNSPYNDHFFLSNINNTSENKRVSEEIKIKIKALLDYKDHGFINIFNEFEPNPPIKAFLYIEKINELGWYLADLVTTEPFETKLKGNIVKQLKFMELSNPIFIFDKDLKFITPLNEEHQKSSFIKEIYGTPNLNSIKSGKHDSFIKSPSKNNTEGKGTTKASYIVSYPPWGWTFGINLGTDEVDEYISSIKGEIDYSLEKTVLNLLVMTMTLLSGLLVAATFFKQKLDLDMKSFIHAFNCSFKTNKLINEDPLKYREFVLLAHQTNKILSEHFKEDKELIKHATFDSLTQVYNRRQFMLLFGIEYRKSLKGDNNLVVIMVDIDNFKIINDKYGHQCGDFVLREFAKICKKIIRRSDLIGRIGGDEFALLLLTLELDDALTIVEKIRLKVEQYNFIYKEHKLPLTISMGVSDIKEYHGENESDMLKIADDYLYKAKNIGRNKMFSRNNKVETKT